MLKEDSPQPLKHRSDPSCLPVLAYENTGCEAAKAQIFLERYALWSRFKKWLPSFAASAIKRCGSILAAPESSYTYKTLAKLEKSLDTGFAFFC